MAITQTSKILIKLQRCARKQQSSSDSYHVGSWTKNANTHFCDKLTSTFLENAIQVGRGYVTGAKVNLDKLVSALESWANRNFDEFYLDLHTGDILSADAMASHDPAKFAEVERSLDRFVLIKPLPPQDIALLMDDFLDTLKNAECKQFLEKVLLHSGTFLDFKCALLEFPQAQAAWDEFHKREMKETAKSWLKSQNVQLPLV